MNSKDLKNIQDFYGSFIDEDSKEVLTDDIKDTLGELAEKIKETTPKVDEILTTLSRSEVIELLAFNQ